MTERIQQTISPVDGSIYVERERATGRQIEATLGRAETSQQSWRQTSVSERVAICKRMLGWLVERADEIGRELTWQMGRPITYSPFEIRRGFQERVDFMCDIAEQELA